MKKITLDLDALEVESFETTPAGDNEEAGTVFGYGSCPSCPTCGAYTCDATCAESCGQPFTTCSCPVRECVETLGGTCSP